MNKSKQLHALRLFRSMCPFLQREGGIGYMCGRGNTTTNGVPYITRITDRQQQRRRCSLACADIVLKAQSAGIKITMSNQQLLSI